MERVFLKRTSRILAGHLWIFSNELSTSPKHFEPGSPVEVYDGKNNFFGIGYINPNSLISVRLLTKEREKIDSDFFHRRINAALEFRKRFMPSLDSCRVIFSESDFLPGLIVDKYENCLVAQILTLGMEKYGDIVLNALDEILSPSVIVLRNDSNSRTLEGLPLEKKVVKGSLYKLPVIKEGGVIAEVDPLSGQKTGFFLDQRENRLALSKIIKGGRGLDLFCYTGAWGLQLAVSGAQVVFVDNSDSALSQAKRNAEINGLGSKCGFIKDDVFKFLNKVAQSGDAYDFVVLDPPAFVKSKSKIKEAIRGYREINAMAMKVIKKGGVLATSSCSHHVQHLDFIDILRNAAKDSGRNARLLDYRSQGRDHPVLLSVPETEYLKCVFLEL